MDKNSFMHGYLLGCKLRKQRPEVKTLVGYSYNGTVLPALPEWNKEALPYGVIVKNTTAQFIVSGIQLTYYNDAVRNLSGFSIQIFRWSFDESSGEWAYDGPVTLPNDKGYKNPVWADYDILNYDGSVYLAASEPIPVYD